MATMDITPQELRDIEIREAWRGYHRDDVDELLERAAATIEHLEMELAQNRGRGGAAPAAFTAPAAAPIVAQPAPVAATPPPARAPETDVIQRTLLLAQKAADEAVADAKVKAQQIVDESEARAQELVAEAEANARRIAEVEKGRLEEDIARLTDARDTLSADVDALERFEQEYRERLRSAIQAELELLETTVAANVRPEVHELDLPESDLLDGGPSWSASQEGVAPAPAPAELSPTPTVHIEAVPAYDADVEADWDPAPAGGWSDAGAAEADQGTELGLVVDDDDYVAQGDSLDDDAFFASLREAVRDDAPLGPARDDDSQYFDEDDTEEHRRLFKRRR